MKMKIAWFLLIVLFLFIITFLRLEEMRLDQKFSQKIFDKLPDQFKKRLIIIDSFPQSNATEKRGYEVKEEVNLKG